MKSSALERSQAVKSFNEDEHVRVILMSTNLAAHGINITGADRGFKRPLVSFPLFLLTLPQHQVILVDPILDPAKEKQAIKRAHRLGQSKPVHVEKLIIQHTIEDTILQISSNSFSNPNPSSSSSSSSNSNSTPDENNPMLRKDNYRIVRTLLDSLRLLPTPIPNVKGD